MPLVLAWLVVLATVVSPIFTGDLTPLLALAFGFGGQLLKAHPKFPNIAAQGIMIVAGVGCFFLTHGYNSADALWFQDAVAYTFAVPGYATVIGTAIPALATHVAPAPAPPAAHA